MRNLWSAVTTAGVLVGVITTHVTAQTSITIAPGPQYGADATHEWFFGSGNRSLWQTPVRVPVLDIGTYAGGLEPVKAGGGKQTNTLHLHGKDGRQYVFRSVDKDPGRALPGGLDGLNVGPLIQDFTALFNPSGAVVVPPLLSAVLVLHVSPQLYMMPQDPRLGEFLPTFGSMLGYLEERPEDGEGKAGFAGASKVVGDEKLQEALRKDSRNRIDERDRLAARLIDFLVGDTDRGPNQWRWARFKDGDSFQWRPIPRDRDFAFVDAGGLIPRIASLHFKRLTSFDDELPKLGVLTFSSLYEDRLLLQSLDGAAWAAIADDVKNRLSDTVIDNAVIRLPPEHYALAGEDIAAKLRTRREELPGVARELYEKLAAFVDVHASERSELAEIRRSSDGAVEIRLYQGGIPEQVASLGNVAVLTSRRPFYERRFVPGETKEVRLYLHGGDDRVLLEGLNSDDAIAVRIIAGDGDDELVDLSINGDGGTHNWFYDEAGVARRATRSLHTHLDRSSFTEPKPPRNRLSTDEWHFRDWGTTSGYSPTLAFRDNTGFIIGAQYGTRDYGFRRAPFKSQGRFNVGYAPGGPGFGAELSGETHFENSQFSVAGNVRASGYDDIRFYGYGNDTRELDSDVTMVEPNTIHASGGLRYGLGDTRFAFGGSMETRDTPIEEGTPLAIARPLGTGQWTQYGVWSSAQTAIGRRVSFAVDAAYHPATGSLNDDYTKGRGEAIVRIGSVPELALRASGEKIWGDAPLHDAAFIGGRKSFRGYSPYRFVGDASVIGNAELRIPAFNHFEFFVLGDAGRVYVDGESPGGWHTAYGGGVTLSVAGRAINAIYANGEGGKFYVTLGRTF